jgi:Domain of unknown function (DUF4365)
MIHGLSKPRKRRTRQHVIAAQSVNYVERFIVDAGYTAQRVEYDYGYDLLVSTFDEEGYEEPGLNYLQLKATDSLQMAATDGEVVFDLAVEDYNLWTKETMPVVLVVFEARKRRAWWLYVQRYFAEQPSRVPKKGAKTIRVFVPAKQRLGPKTIAAMRKWKQDILEQSWGRIERG